ncbi:MAG: MBL fold metallo-hydrolase [Anaerolineaceae bacterium]|nr:MBL fold metallo-hydrolase [Anaerolineaceae bacterium]
MQRERISDNVFWFQSDIYAQVTAGVIVGPQWSVLIDTLAMPDETLAMRSFIEDDLRAPVRYIINTHSHADHSWGNCFFPGATIIGHAICRSNMLENETAALEESSKHNPALKNVKIIAPHITLRNGTLTLKVGKKTLNIFASDGHSDDGISILIEEDRVLFAGDAFLPLPYIVNGDLHKNVATLQMYHNLTLENIIQGHGDIILRGEIDAAIENNITYLTAIETYIEDHADSMSIQEIITEASIEEFGKERILLGGLVDSLHKRNLVFLYQKCQNQHHKEKDIAPL